MKGEKWTREELILVLDLYLNLPDKKYNNTPKVQELAQLMGRTSIVMRLLNFVACDPNRQEKGLDGGKSKCLPIWNEFAENRESLRRESERIRAELKRKKQVLISDKQFINIHVNQAHKVNTIQMGNDEFILYIRKNYPKCLATNDTLGKKIWEWIQKKDPNAVQINDGIPVPTMWDGGANVNAYKLPQTATQFEFDRTLLVSLYDYLDALGTGGNNAGNALSPLSTN
jgi:hypothetical protein